jgi:hypothetical protein
VVNILPHYRSLGTNNGDKDAAIDILKEVLKQRGVHFIHMVSPTMEKRVAKDSEVDALLRNKCSKKVGKMKQDKEKEEKMMAKIDALNAAAAAAAGLAYADDDASTTKSNATERVDAAAASATKKRAKKVKNTTTTKSSARGMAAASASANKSSAATKKVMKAAKSRAATKNSHVEVTKRKSVDDDLGFLDKELSDEGEEVTEEEVTPKKKPVKRLRLVCDLTGDSTDESSGESSDESPSHEKKKRRGFGEDASDASWTGEEE